MALRVQEAHRQSSLRVVGLGGPGVADTACTMAEFCFQLVMPQPSCSSVTNRWYDKSDASYGTESA